VLAANLAFAGLGIGCVAALIGIGLIATYRLTGVFNLGFGSIAMLVAYLLWQMVTQWHWPLWPSVLLAVFVIAPAIGWVLDAAVFRQLQRRGASEAERLVAGLGVLVLCVGIAYLAWGSNARTNPPQLFPTTAVSLGGGVRIASSVLYDLGAVLLATVLTLVVTHATRIGTSMRAVVNGRELAELAGVDTDALSAIAASFGSFLAGLAGVLLATQLRLDPVQPTLVVLETMVVAVIAGMSRPAVAVVAALAIGVAQSELTLLHWQGNAGVVLRALQSNLFVVALLITVIALPRLIPARDGGMRFSTVVPTPRASAGWTITLIVLLLMPLGFSAADLRTALQLPGLAIIFVSLVAVSGLAGQISLGQAGYAGLGALVCAALTTHGSVPALVAILLAGVLVTPVGVLTGWPAIRRHGIALAITTFAVGAVASRFVFAQPVFTSDLRLRRPGPFASDRTFYLFALVVLGLAVLVVVALRAGRTGRALAAIRDDEDAARAAGVNVSLRKIEVFAVASLLAGVGGALLGQATQAFDAATFDPVQGLLWFGAVVVFGSGDIAGAVLAAGLLLGIDSATVPGASAALVGVLALLLGRMPGGLMATLRRAVGTARSTPPPRPGLRLTPRGEQVAAVLRRSAS
jgi:branched-subunit amino acid ABC-type transport system permease component